MKKFKFLSLLIIISVFSACKKEKNSDPKSSIVGKWYWVEQTYDSYVNNVLTQHEDYTTTLDPTSYFEFDSDGKFIENPQDRNGQFKYGTYQTKGDSLFINENAVNYRWAIETLSASSLIIHETTGVAPYRGEVTYSMKR
jgi:hypothetical protein